MFDDATSGQERTESPTPRRRELAREEGRVARSVELSTSAVLLGGTIVLATVGASSLAGYAKRLLRESATWLSEGPMNEASSVTVLRTVCGGFVLAALPFLVGLAAIVIFVNLVQARGVVSWKAVAPKWSNVDPVGGMRRLMGGEALFNLFKSVAKLIALGLVTYTVITHSWVEMVSVEVPPADIATVLRALTIRLAVLTGLSFLTISAIDYAFQWYKMEKSLRMTRQEIIHESRESEGDPMIKSRIRAMGQALARRRMIQQVPRADVVIVNPTEIAIALKYDTDVAPAPIVVAMGQRKLAERIKAVALEAKVPVLENRPVARALLATAKVGRPIPPALYVAVAEILAFVFRHRASIAGSVISSTDMAMASGRTR